MNGRVRLLLCGACLVVGLFESHGAMHVFAQDLRGPYDGAPARASVDAHGNLVYAQRAVSDGVLLEARVSDPSGVLDEGDHVGRRRDLAARAAGR